LKKLWGKKSVGNGKKNKLKSRKVKGPLVTAHKRRREEAGGVIGDSGETDVERLGGRGIPP